MKNEIKIRPKEPRQLEPLDDDSLMPIGKDHLNKPMIDIPDQYFIWFWGENEYSFRKMPETLSDNVMRVMIYIDTHFDHNTLS